MNRRLTLLITLFLTFAFYSVSESASLKSRIVGKWFKEDDLAHSLEFLKDDTVIFAKQRAVVGSYKFIDDNRLKVDFGNVGIFGSGAMVFEASIDKEGRLILKEPTGEITKYIIEADKKKREAEAEAEKEKLIVKDDRGTVWGRRGLMPDEFEKNQQQLRQFGVSVRKISPDDFEKVVNAFTDKYQVGEKDGWPVVHPPADSDVYLTATGLGLWKPILELEVLHEYTLHISTVSGGAPAPLVHDFIINFPFFSPRFKIIPGYGNRGK